MSPSCIKAHPGYDTVTEIGEDAACNLRKALEGSEAYAVYTTCIKSTLGNLVTPKHDREGITGINEIAISIGYDGSDSDPTPWNRLKAYPAMFNATIRTCGV